MMVRSQVTRVCTECGDAIEPGDWYDNVTGECVDCVKMDDISVGYKGAKVVHRAAEYHEVMAEIEKK